MHMETILIIKLFLVVIGSAYAVGLFLVWWYENKKTRMYRIVLRQIDFLKSLRLSMALLHVKIFKVEQDYRQWSEMIDGRQQFIFEKVLFLRKSTLKIKYKQGYHFQG